MRRFWIRSAVVSLLAGGLVAPGASPAEAAICGVGTDIAFGQVGKNAQGVGYPVTLHGTTVRLYTGRTTAKAYVKIDRELLPNEILSIDRSKNTTSTKWPTTSQVSAWGGWYYCEQRYQGVGGPISTPTVNGDHYAVRACLRRAGALQCANIWYADQDS